MNTSINNSISGNDILQYAIENGIIDLASVQEKIEMNMKEKLLAKHPYKIWQAENGKWNTYFPDTKGGRIRRIRNTEKEIKDLIVEYWDSHTTDLTVQGLYNEWINKKITVDKIEKSTKDRYNRQFIQCFSSIANEPVKNFNECSMTDFIEATIIDCQLTVKGFSNFRTLLFGIFKRAKKKGLIDFYIKDVVDDLEISEKSFRKIEHSEDELVFSETDTRKIFNYFKYNEMDIIDMGLYLIFKTGLRPGELAAIKKEDMKGNFIRVCRTEIFYDNEDGETIVEVRDSPKTKAGIRVVVIPKNMEWLLLDIRNTYTKGEYAFQIDGKRVTAGQFRRRLMTICKTLKIVNKSPNKIRKTYGTMLLDAGVDESLILSQMGHTNILTTKKYYYKDRKDLDKKEEMISNAITE